MVDDRIPGSLRPGATLGELQAAVEEIQRTVSAWVGKQPMAQLEIGANVTEPTATAFTVMPFGPEDLQFVYQYNVKPTLEKCGLKCVRGDDMFGSDVIIEDVLSGISKADMVIADLTGQNANVFYEVGVAHAMNKPVLLLAQSLDDVPFDLRHRRILIYEYSPPGLMRFVENFEKHLQGITARDRRLK